MQGNCRESDQVSLGAYNLYLTRISSWLDDSEVRLDARRFRLEQVQEEVELGRDEFRDEFRAVEEEGEIKASLSFELDDLVCRPAPDATVQRRGRRALDLGSRRSFSIEIESMKNFDMTPEKKDVGRVYANAGKKLADKIKQVGLIGAATLGILVLTLRH